MGALALGLAPASGHPPAPVKGFGVSGLSGSAARMQPVNLPARVSRIAYVPGTSGREAWALGRLTGYLEGWPAAGSGQLVFLHYTARSGWLLDGPPRDSRGAVANPTLSGLALAASGEGWAVGPAGVLVHHRPGEGWQVLDGCATPACADLASVSLFADGDRIGGFAVGNGGTVLALLDGAWSPDTAALEVGATSDLIAVAASSSTEAWAVTGPSSRDLSVYHREGAAWVRHRTGRVIFDGPNPTADSGSGAANLSALGSSVAIAPDGAVWVGGGIYPLNATKPAGDPSVGDTERPFTLRFHDGAFTAYCPDDYTFSSQGLSVARVCDAPMPLAAYAVTSLAPLPGGEVFAGGLGLFRFRDGAWSREPDAVGYLSSIAFASPTEGWVATSGDTIGVSAVARSTSITVGHFTDHPQTPGMARWGQTNDQVLQAVAISPDASEALAVGSNGATVHFRPETGWDVMTRKVAVGLHAVAWSGPREAWAVGERGYFVHLVGDRLEADDAAQERIGRSLFGLAFNERGRGVAVGINGTIATNAGGKWILDPASGRLTHETIYAVTRVGDGFVAVGSAGTVLRNESGRPGDWQADGAAAAVVHRDNVPDPTFWAVAALSDGRVLVGGDRSALVVRERDGRWRPFGDPLEGSIIALAASRGPGTPKVFASVSPTAGRYLGDEVATAQAWLFAHDGTRWRDVDLRHQVTLHAQQDRAAPRDPVLALDVEPSSARGWAVGGTRENLPDGDGHLFSSPTGSVFRIDTEGDPRQPNTSVVPSYQSALGSFSFAFFSESACGAGLCSTTIGSATNADVAALAIQDDINRHAALANGPRFVLFGGNGRIAGLPEELAQFQGYLSRFNVPAFGAMGSHDLFSPLTSGVRVPPGFGDAYLKQQKVDRTVAPANQYYLQSFADQAAPWGTSGPQEPGFVPVNIGAAPQAGLARTHYAFDYAPSGDPLARFIVLDASDGSLRQPTNPRGQNPNEDQVVWLNAVLTDAKAQNPPLATFIVVNQPTVDPTTAVNGPIMSPADGRALETAATSFGVSAVFSGFLRTNSFYYVPQDAAPVRVPFFIGGGGGAPVDGSHYPEDGHYSGWMLVNVDRSGVSLLQPQARVTVRTIPVLESLAIHALDGFSTPGGQGLHFSALGRAPDGGGVPDDPNQGLRTYLHLPLPFTCPDAGPGNGGCFGRSAMRPDYHFVSEDPTIAAFVRENSGNPGTPLVLADGIIADDQSGFLCTFKAGTTYVDVVSGFLRARVKITVGAGEGPCVEHPVIGLPPAPAPAAVPVPPPAAVPAPAIHHPSPIPPVPDALGVVLPPSPPPIAAPAPPASAAGAKKEEKEYQHQKEGQEGDGKADFRAIPAARHERAVDASWWPALIAVLAGAGAARVATSRRRAVARVEVWR